MSGRRKVTQYDALTLSRKLSTRTHFTQTECTSLLTMHSKILEDGELDRLRFREVLHACFDLFEDLMLDRVFCAFDKDNNGVVDAVEWVLGCSIIIRGDPDELIQYAYFVYNINGDDTLDREELVQYLRKTFFVVPNVLPQEDLEECQRDIVDICMKKLDKDRDSQISYKDFEQSCHVDPLLVQSLGPCIPPTRSLAAFLATFSEDPRSYTSIWGDVWFRFQDPSNPHPKGAYHNLTSETSLDNGDLMRSVMKRRTLFALNKKSETAHGKSKSTLKSNKSGTPLNPTKSRSPSTPTGSNSIIPQ